MSFIDENYILRVDGNAVEPTKDLICMFCASKAAITKEHIIPRWIFEKETDKFFNITLNGHDQTYNKSTIPACDRCNAELLNSLEKTIQTLFSSGNMTNNSYTLENGEDVIRWLEIIDYKFHIMNISKRFLSPKNGDHIPYLKDFPLYILLPNKDYSPYQVLTEIRSVLKRISVKRKVEKINSLVIFTTSNKSRHFFHTLNDFIFLELPKYQLALFYFYKREFDTPEEAHHAAMKIINKVY
ncbi:hypothetical protein [Pedobacter sp. V48]|uniref:hypothetical protein n=1 Tax=Pedobacter sp. V48 TaxID=509635 RepID=UPI00126957DC|nr:hypothetical protein [Pedobacter sp. V48]